MKIDHSTDVEVLRAVVDWLDSGSRIFLVTVAGTWGSAPRRPGSMMAVHPDGQFIGSVSGGCVEDDLAQKIMKGEFEHKLPSIIEYGVTREQTQRIGLPCGGRLKLLVERIDSISQMRKLLQTVESQQLISRHVCLNTGEASLRPSRDDKDFQIDGQNLIKVFGPRWRMLLVGAGELSRRVAQLAMTLGYAVTLCDSRPEYADSWQVDGTGFSTMNTADAITALHPDPRTVVLALSHTPALDDPALAVALQSNAFYVGALGSLKNQQARLSRLQQKGLSSTQLAHLHGPVGLAIGSRTPAEIAIAIMAALVAERNQTAHQATSTESIYA
ncbi:MAG: XdhC family protein [Pseudomonadota bacterium]|nr:XdhC family protein [Pseudomonadota bacterium]